MKRLLVQTQLSNYDTKGNFILEADSGWQMVMGRVRVMLNTVPDLHVDVMCPMDDQVITGPEDLYSDVYATGRVTYKKHRVIANALATRYDFDFEGISKLLGLANHRDNETLRYTHMYINDPMHLRNFKSLFYLKAGYQPHFSVHSHFIDNPEAPKFPMEGSLWLGQVEAAARADYNFWQCESALGVFLQSLQKDSQKHVVHDIQAKSMPWDDGYSQQEITSEIDFEKLRFTLSTDKVVVFVPNRVGGMGRSSDYTNCGKFLFEHCNELWKQRQDFVVIAGNPSQKFSNEELNSLCKPYRKLINGTFTRNEYRYVARKSHIAVGLYNVDSYGGTAARECVELDCLPLWVNNYEYKILADHAGYPFMANTDLSNVTQILSDLIDYAKTYCRKITDAVGTVSYEDEWQLKEVNRQRCSYEETTHTALKKMGLL
jgi:hypothetical protein